MFKFVSFCIKPKNVETQRTETASKFLIKYNEMFKIFLNNCSWFVYLIGALLILLCIYYYFVECKRRLDIRRRRQNFQSINERSPQRRRPGGIYRDHEIFRNAIRTVRQYIGFNGRQDKSLHFKRTRSGLVYGSFSNKG